MSSVSNESRRDDVVRRTKEDYYTKEAENTRKHKAELRNLTEQYQKEVEELKAEHAAKVEQLEGYMRGRLSRQEVEHQNQMQDMRDVASQQLRKKIEESQTMHHEQKDTYESELNRQKTVYENQRARLETQFQNELKKKEEAFQNYSKFAQDESAKTWDERREKLQKNTHEQLERERSNHQNQLANVNRQLTEVRKTKDNDINQLKLQKEYEKSRIELANRQNQQSQEKMNAAVHEAMARDTQSQQQLIKEKYREELDRKIAAIDDSQSDFRKTTSERINNQITGLKADLKNEQNERVVEKTALDRRAALEKKHLTQDYEKRLADERYQKQEALARVNQEVDEEVNKAVKSRDSMLKDLSDEHLRQREMKRAQSAAQISQMKNDMQSHEDHVTQRADSKVGRANELVRQNNVRMQKYYGDNLDLIKKDFMKELNDERIRHIEERSDLEGRLEKKIRDRERVLSQELDQKVVMYEDRLQEQKHTFGDELRRKDEEYRSQLQARERNHKDAMKSLEMKYQNQIQQTKDTYDGEMEAMEKRHREEMNHLAQKMSERQKRS